jgi:hypothetical protein
MCVEYDFRISDGCICIINVTSKPLGIIYFHGNVYSVILNYYRGFHGI